MRRNLFFAFLAVATAFPLVGCRRREPEPALSFSPVSRVYRVTLYDAKSRSLRSWLTTDFSRSEYGANFIDAKTGQRVGVTGAVVIEHDNPATG